MKPTPPKPWYSLFVKEVFLKLTTNESGLTSVEAKNRLIKYGPNQLPEAKPDTYLKIFLRQFQSSLIYVLLGATVIVAIMGEYIDAAVIAGVLLLNAVIGTFQEGKAQNTLQALKRFTTTEALVKRDGQSQIIASTEVVPGDIITLKDGDKVPADARLIEVANLRVDQSALTGESSPVKKSTESITTEDLSTADQSNMVFKGTFITGGLGKAVVVATGSNTVVGKISKRLETIDTEVPLKANIRFLSKVIIIAVVIINIFLVAIGLIYGNTPEQMFMTVVAVAVSAIPEGLPVVITLVLATGVWRMSQRQALIKRLQAVEALGQAKVIAVDKTGTITKNELMIREVYVGDEIFTVTGSGYDPAGTVFKEDQSISIDQSQALKQMATLAAFNAGAQVNFLAEEDKWQISGDPTEAALLVFAGKALVDKSQLEKTQPQVFEIPFDTQLKYHITIHQTGQNYTLTAIGAPEVILQLAASWWRPDGVDALTKDRRAKIENQFTELSKRGLRVVAVAYTDQSPTQVEANQLPPLTFVGLYAMSDVIRSEAKEAVARSHQAGVRVIMITGDHKITAAAIAEAVGIWQPQDEIMTGQDLNQLSTEELAASIGRVSVFARVTPEHKLRIIESFRQRGEKIAMTGDGVNDALSLVAADLGVAMGKSGTEVAKEAADIVLLDDNFGSIVSAIEEGRSIYQTIKKVVLYLFATNIGEILVITGAILLGWPLPLLASQIIWLNMVTDGFLVAALAMEPKERNLLRGGFLKPGRWLVDKLMAKRMALMGGVMMVATLVVFSQVLPAGANALNGDQYDLTYAWTMVLTTLAIFQWFNVWNCRSTTDSIFKMKLLDNKYLAAATVLIVGLHLFAVYAPFMQTILRTTALTLSDWLVAILAATSILAIEEIRKLLARIKTN